MEIKYRNRTMMIGEFHLVMYERTLIVHDGVVTFCDEPPAHVKEFLARKGYTRLSPEAAPQEPPTPEPETPAPETPQDPEPEAPATEPVETPAPEPEPSSPVDLKGKGRMGKGGKKSDK